MAIPSRYAEAKEETKEVMFDPEDFESAREDPAQPLMSEQDIEVSEREATQKRDTEYITLE